MINLFMADMALRGVRPCSRCIRCFGLKGTEATRSPTLSTCTPNCRSGRSFSSQPVRPTGRGCSTATTSPPAATTATAQHHGGQCPCPVLCSNVTSRCFSAANRLWRLERLRRGRRCAWLPKRTPVRAPSLLPPSTAAAGHASTPRSSPRSPARAAW